MSKIICQSEEEMTRIASLLVERGIIFVARSESGNWVIELTGEY